MNYYSKYKKYKSKYYALKQGGFQDETMDVSITLPDGSELTINIARDSTIAELKNQISQTSEHEEERISVYEYDGYKPLSNDVRLSGLVDDEVTNLSLGVITSDIITINIRIYPELSCARCSNHGVRPQPNQSMSFFYYIPERHVQPHSSDGQHNLYQDFPTSSVVSEPQYSIIITTNEIELSFLTINDLKEIISNETNILLRDEWLELMKIYWISRRNKLNIFNPIDDVHPVTQSENDEFYGNNIYLLVFNNPPPNLLSLPRLGRTPNRFTREGFLPLLRNMVNEGRLLYDELNQHGVEEGRRRSDLGPEELLYTNCVLLFSILKTLYDIIQNKYDLLEDSQGIKEILSEIINIDGVSMRQILESLLMR